MHARNMESDIIQLRRRLASRRRRERKKKGSMQCIGKNTIRYAYCPIANTDSFVHFWHAPCLWRNEPIPHGSHVCHPVQYA